MPNLTPYFYELTKTTKTNQYIETGTYCGDGIQRVLDNYSTVHSIELSYPWIEHSRQRFRNESKVIIYGGDSKIILPEILKHINEPVTIYLDAHFSGGTTAYGEEETPLLHELEILKERPYDDIIIIDDTRMLGKRGWGFDWREITDTKVRELMKDGYVLLKNTEHLFTDDEHADQYVLVKSDVFKHIYSSPS